MKVVQSLTPAADFPLLYLPRVRPSTICSLPPSLSLGVRTVCTDLGRTPQFPRIFDFKIG